jgi:hypothetical protein
MYSNAGRSVALSSSHRAGGFPGVRSKFAVIHLDPAAKLNMTDEQWVQRISKIQTEGAIKEIAEKERRAKMLKDI